MCLPARTDVPTCANGAVRMDIYTSMDVHTCTDVSLGPYLYGRTCTDISVQAYLYRHTCTDVPVWMYLYRRTDVPTCTDRWMYLTYLYGQMYLLVQTDVGRAYLPVRTEEHTCRDVPVGTYLYGGTCRDVPVGMYLYGRTCRDVPVWTYL